MATRSRPRTVLQVSRNEAGDIEIALTVDAESSRDKQRLVVRSEHIAALIDMLQQYVHDDDPEDRSTLRNLRTVT
jgi:hypothetical protein